MQLVWPFPTTLPSYAQARQHGWSPNNLRPDADQEKLTSIQADSDAFVTSLVDRERKGAPWAGGAVWDQLRYQNLKRSTVKKFEELPASAQAAFAGLDTAALES